MGSHKECCRKQPVYSSYDAGSRSRAENWYPRLLCNASAISAWRLRNLEVHCADPEIGMEVKGVRAWNLGWRDSARVRTSAGRCRGLGALGFQRLRQYGS